VGSNFDRILQEQKIFKNKKNQEIENILIDRFGKASLIPKSDIDRPFTPDELKDFSKEKYVFLGNHTGNHAILTNYSNPEIEEQIQIAQNDIINITNVNPIMISYPNGNFSGNVVDISKKLGLKLGVTLLCKKNYLPINSKNNSLFRLGRFEVVEGYDIAKQCMLFRSDIVFYRSFVNLMNKGY